ncbi:MAG: hypothetical protein IKV94_05420 [Clostridia bacterium]|nr:hypothetical protein [Clostridia bacterium]
MQNSVAPYVEDIIQGLNVAQTANKSGFDLQSITTSLIKEGSDLLNLPSMQQLKNIDWSDLKGALTIIGTTLIIILFSSIIMYIFKSIGLYKIMKKEGHNLAWISFIPYGCFYAIGKSVGKTKLYGIEIDHTEYVLPLILLSSILPFMGGLSSIIFILAFFGLLFRLYQKKSPNFAAVLTILSILVPFIIPFFIFAIRNK